MIDEYHYSPSELAEIQGCCTKTILRKLKAGQIPGAQKSGGVWRIPKESVNDYERGAATHRRFDTERNLLRGAAETISLLGINSLGILHQNREMLVSKLNERVKIRVLLLDPDCKAFKVRAKDEEERNGRISGRLRAESLASYAICKDIYNFIDSPNDKENFSLRYYSARPTMALVITDHQRSSGYCSSNQYPLTMGQIIDEDTGEEREGPIPVKNRRGLCGTSQHFPNKGTDRVIFTKFVQIFNTMWDNAKEVDLSKDYVFKECTEY